MSRRLRVGWLLGATAALLAGCSLPRWAARAPEAMPAGVAPHGQTPPVRIFADEALRRPVAALAQAHARATRRPEPELRFVSSAALAATPAEALGGWQFLAASDAAQIERWRAGGRTERLIDLGARRWCMVGAAADARGWNRRVADPSLRLAHAADADIAELLRRAETAGLLAVGEAVKVVARARRLEESADAGAAAADWLRASGSALVLQDCGAARVTLARGVPGVVAEPLAANWASPQKPVLALLQPAPGSARAFADFILGPQGRQILADLGHGAP